MKHKKDVPDSLSNPIPKWKLIAMAHCNYADTHFIPLSKRSEKKVKSLADKYDESQKKPTNKEMNEYPREG